MQTRKTTWLATMTTLTLKITKKSLLMKTRKVTTLVIKAPLRSL